MLLIGAIVVAWKWERIGALIANIGMVLDGAEVAATLDSVDSLLTYIDANRTGVSLVAYRLVEADRAILLNPDVPRPVASTGKLLVLAGYAEAVAEGRWTPEERVPLAAVDAFFLPHTDGGAHQRAVETYRDRGWIDASGNVALQRLPWAMMATSDNAATDYLLTRLGRDRAESLPARLDATGSDAPVPISGLFLSWKEAGGDWSVDAAWQFADLLHSDPGFRRARRDEIAGQFRLLREQVRLIHAFSPRGTTRDYSALMARVLGGELISPSASVAMRGFLELAMEREQSTRAFKAVGGKSGNLPGVLTAAMYGVPRDVASGGVASLFLENLPLAVWFVLTANDLHQEFLQRLLSDPEFFEHVRRRLDTRSTFR